MSLGHSPKIVTDGLVFYYDMNNRKKSFLGAPTVNLIANAGQNAAIERSSDGSVYGYFSANITADILANWTASNNKVSMSFEGKRDYTVGGTGGGADGYPRMYIYFGDWTWSSSFGATSYDWTYNTQNNITVPDPTGKTVYMTIYHMNSGNPGRSYSRNHQLEFGTYATPFVNGTRTLSNNFVDLTGNNTITANNLTYSSDGSFSFSQPSSSWIDSGMLHPSTNEFTIQCWVKPGSSQTAYAGIVGNHAGGYTGMFCQQQNTTLNAYTWGTGNGSSWGNYSNFTLTTNNWHHLVLVKTATNNYTYINGSLVTTVATNGLSLGASNIGFGRDYINTPRYWNGSIDAGAIYNRALTAAEVQQNFNALRGRYGI